MERENEITLQLHKLTEKERQKKINRMRLLAGICTVVNMIVYLNLIRKAGAMRGLPWFTFCLIALALALNVFIWIPGCYDTYDLASGTAGKKVARRLKWMNIGMPFLLGTVVFLVMLISDYGDQSPINFPFLCYLTAGYFICLMNAAKKIGKKKFKPGYSLAVWLYPAVFILINTPLIEFPAFVIGLVLVLVTRPQIILVIVILIFVHRRRKKREWEKKKNPVEYGGFDGTVIVGLYDFYIPFDYRKRFSMNYIMSLKRIFPDAKLYDDFLALEGKEASKYLFYYHPEELYKIDETEIEECIGHIIDRLNRWSEEGKIVLAVCDKKEYERENWDILTRRLYDETEFSLWFEVPSIQTINSFDNASTVIAYRGEKLDVLRNVKCRYVIEQLTECTKASNEVQEFYGLIKIVEYIFQYRGLYALSRSEVIDLSAISFSMGGWNEIQLGYGEKGKEEYREQGLLQAFANVKKSHRAKITYRDICMFLVELRNRYIGHGTMAYSVSPELLDSVFRMVRCILDEFIKDENIQFNEKTALSIMLKAGGKKEIPCMVRENGRSYYLSFLEKGEEEGDMAADYINFETGKIVIRGKLRRWKLKMNGEGDRI